MVPRHMIHTKGRFVMLKLMKHARGRFMMQAFSDLWIICIAGIYL